MKELIGGSLATGIGGLDYGLELTKGFKVIWQSEIDPYACKVLKKHWPGVPNLGDMFDITNPPYADIVFAGIPCQGQSLAGKRKGDQDERWLWPEMFRIVCEVGPKYVLVENVPGLLSVHSGREFGTILKDLATVGYDVEWNMLSAAGIGAPHLRKRIFVVAYRNNNRCEGEEIPDKQRREEISESSGGSSIVADTIGKRRKKGCNGESGPIDSNGTSKRAERWDDKKLADTASKGLKGSSGKEFQQIQSMQGGSKLSDPNQFYDNGGRYGTGTIFGKRPETSQIQECRQWISEPFMGGVVDGLSDRLDNSGARDFCKDWFLKGHEKEEVTRVAVGIRNRIDRLKCVGNAVVPQVAQYIGELILDFDQRRIE